MHPVPVAAAIHGAPPPLCHCISVILMHPVPVAAAIQIAPPPLSLLHLCDFDAPCACCCRHP
eukprot:1158591-Pelagomonas_calceolata.AAC.6